MGLYRADGRVVGMRSISTRRTPGVCMLVVGLMLALWLWLLSLSPAHPAAFPAIAPIAPHLLYPCNATPLPC